MQLVLMGADAAYIGAVALLTVTAGVIYIWVWRASDGRGRVPTGFGALLAPIMLGAGLVAGAPVHRLLGLSFATLATALYWFDDVNELSARLRLLLSFIAGAAIGALCFWGQDMGLSLALGGGVAAGVVCVVLTNLVNFYDGADLNLGTYILLTAALIVAFGPEQREWTLIALAVLAFVLPFGLLNGRPQTVYLGDSGSFAFASLLTIMAMAFVADIGSLPPEAAIPSALPAFDVFFVFCIRVHEGHDLLSRNYLHLYQRLNRNYPPFLYLLPQFANALLCLACAAALQAAGMGRMVSVIAAMAVTIPFYLVFRHVFVVGKPIGPPQATW